MDQWETLVLGKQRSKREEMLYNIDPLRDGKNGNNAAIRVGQYKLIKGDPGKPSGWIPPPSVTDVQTRGNDDIFVKLDNIFNTPDSCPHPEVVEEKVLLYDLSKDPYEKNDLSKKYPKIVAKLKKLLSKYEASMIPPDVKERVGQGNPSHFDNNWSSGWCQSEP